MCSRPAAPALTREAFLTFDNLTGDAGSRLDRASRAPNAGARSDRRAEDVPLSAPTVRDAYLERAARLVHGYYEMRSGKLHFEIAVEDADGSPHDPDRRRRRPTRGSHESRGEESRTLARSRSPLPLRPPLPGARAITNARSRSNLSSRWLGSAGHKNSPPAAITPKRAKCGSRSGATRSRFQHRQGETGAGCGHAAPGRRGAPRSHAQARRTDSLRSRPADVSGRARHGGAQLQRGREGLPTRPASRAFGLQPPQFARVRGSAGGQSGRARKSFEEYGRGPGEDAVNALDSLGEALFINGKFEEAEQQIPGRLQQRSKVPGRRHVMEGRACALACRPLHNPRPIHARPGGIDRREVLPRSGRGARSSAPVAARHLAI